MNTTPHTAAVKPTLKDSLWSWPTQVCNLSTILTLRCPVRVEPVVVMGGAIGGDRHRTDPERRGSGGEDGAQIDVGGRPFRAAAEPLRDFRTYFIAVATNAYATMHYNITMVDTCRRTDGGDYVL